MSIGIAVLCVGPSEQSEMKRHLCFAGVGVEDGRELRSTFRSLLVVPFVLNVGNPHNLSLVLGLSLTHAKRRPRLLLRRCRLSLQQVWRTPARIVFCRRPWLSTCAAVPSYCCADLNFFLHLAILRRRHHGLYYCGRGSGCPGGARCLLGHEKATRPPERRALRAATDIPQCEGTR